MIVARETMRHLTKTAVVSLIIVALLGCTQNPYTREDQVSSTAKGATAGAATGAAIGAAAMLLSGGRSADARKAALIGAGIGLLAGLLVGQTMDRQEAVIRERLEAAGVSVTRRGDNLVLNMQNSIQFDSGQTSIAAKHKPVIAAVAEVFKEFDKSLIDVYGFTDSRGSAALNKRVSRQRAESVAQELILNGIDPRRVTFDGLGEENPIAPNDTPEGRRANRRVEILVQPLV